MIIKESLDTPAGETGAFVEREGLDELAKLLDGYPIELSEAFLRLVNGLDPHTP